MMRWTGRLEGLPRFISHAFDLAQAPRKGMGSSHTGHINKIFQMKSALFGKRAICRTRHNDRVEAVVVH